MHLFMEMMQKQGDLTPFVEMFLAIISDAAHSAYNQIIEYVDRLKYFEDLLYSKNS